MGLKLIHICKRGPSCQKQSIQYTPSHLGLIEEFALPGLDLFNWSIPTPNCVDSLKQGKLRFTARTQNEATIPIGHVTRTAIFGTNIPHPPPHQCFGVNLTPSANQGLGGPVNISFGNHLYSLESFCLKLSAIFNDITLNNISNPGMFLFKNIDVICKWFFYPFKCKGGRFPFELF